MGSSLARSHALAPAISGAAGRWLLLLAAALAGVVVLEIVLPGPEPEAPPMSALPPPPAPAPSDPAPDDGGQVAKLAATILARPLLAPDRRPVAAPAAAPAVVGVVPRLSAVIVGSSEALAIFAAAPDGKPVVVRTGQAVGGYVLQSIVPGRVTLAGPDGTRTLRTAFDTAAVAAPVTTQIVVAVAPGLPIEGSRQTLRDLVFNTTKE